MQVAAKYFDRDHCTLIRSNMGFPKKDAAIKPDWDHLDAQNQGAQSPFAKRIANRKVKPIKPQIIDFEKDVEVIPVSEHCNLYATKNPKNDLFSLNICYHYGTADNHNLEVASEYFSQLGAGDMTLQQFNIELDRLGGSFYFSSDYDYSYLHIAGLEKNRDKIIDLVMQKLKDPRHDAQQLDNLVENIEASKRAAKNDASTWTDALYEYVLYGEHSEYIDHTTLKEIKQFKGEDLIDIIQNIYSRDGYITYVGNDEPKEIAIQLHEHGFVRDEVTVMPQRIRKSNTPNENAVFYATNKKFLKSDIDFRIPSSPFDYEKDRAACALFNEYMSGSMAGVFFQEIREFRSLGYSTRGHFGYDRFNRNPAYYYGYLGTQCDKTNDGVAAVRDIMLTFPERKEKFESARDYLISTRNSNYITFRNIPSQIRYWKEVEKVDRDPRIAVTKELSHLTYDDLKAFHKKYVEGRPMSIFITGNAKKYNLKDLSQYGKVQEVKYKDMIKF